jgi:DNA-binding CsgD family transcriptional regulator
MQELTEIEEECIILLSQGKTRKDISTELGYTPGTIEQYLNHAYSKLGAKNAPHAVILALIDYPHIGKEILRRNKNIA